MGQKPLLHWRKNDHVVCKPTKRRGFIPVQEPSFAAEEEPAGDPSHARSADDPSHARPTRPASKPAHRDSPACAETPGSQEED